MRENNIKEDLENYIYWCKSQGTGLNPQEWLTFCFYMEHVYPYADGCIHMHTYAHVYIYNNIIG